MILITHGAKMTPNNNQLTKYEQPIGSLANFNILLLAPAMQNRIADILQDPKNRERFNNIAINVVNSTKKIEECDAFSIIFACLRGYELGLNMSLGEAWIVSYKNKKKGTTNAQFQLGWKGFMQLALNSGRYRAVNVKDVREGEYLGINDRTGDDEFRFIKDADERANLKIIGYVGFLVGKDDSVQNLFMTIAQLENHGKMFSVTYNFADGCWKMHTKAMYEKTIIKQLLSKKATLSIEMQTAMQSDQAVMNDYNKYEYIDNLRSAEHQEAVAQLEGEFKKHFDDNDDDDYDAIENFTKSDDNSTEMFTNNKPSAQVD